MPGPQRGKKSNGQGARSPGKRRGQEREMSGLTLFGLLAVTLMLLFYALEKRSHWFILAFSGSCVLASAYGFLQGAWPFGLVEAVWSLVALRRWRRERRAAIR
jgi:hypothetical protein